MNAQNNEYMKFFLVIWVCEIWVHHVQFARYSCTTARMRTRVPRQFVRQQLGWVYENGNMVCKRFLYYFQLVRYYWFYWGHSKWIARSFFNKRRVNHRNIMCSVFAWKLWRQSIQTLGCKWFVTHSWLHTGKKTARCVLGGKISTVSENTQTIQPIWWIFKHRAMKGLTMNVENATLHVI